jgi:hypothetical protein
VARETRTTSARRSAADGDVCADGGEDVDDGDIDE